MSLFYPDIMLENVYKIDIEFIKEKNIRAIVFDIDNTLAYNKEATPSEKVVEFIRNLNESGIYTVVASNNTEERVKEFCKDMNCLYVHRANKPLGKKIKRMLKEIGVHKKNSAIVGDQIFTDVLCGNLIGMFSILVKPFDSNENKFIKFKRKVEKLFIKW